jgi:PAS domain S-box-containing protein
MDFSTGDVDVEMSMHDDRQTIHQQQQQREVNMNSLLGLPVGMPMTSMGVGVGAVGVGMDGNLVVANEVQSHSGFPNFVVPGVVAPTPTAQNDAFTSVEEYAALMGITLENPTAEATAASMAQLQYNTQQQQQQHQQQQNAQDLAKIQANAAYFESLYRERATGMDSFDNVTSMTLPAGIGSGLYGNVPGGSPFNTGMTPMFAAVSNGTTTTTTAPPIETNTSSFSPIPPQQMAAATGTTTVTIGSTGTTTRTATTTTNVIDVGNVQMELGSQTLSPEILSNMLKSNPYKLREFAKMKDEERAAFLKEEKSRERNRDHSRKSRLRKKEFVENLKQEVQQLQIYQQICEQCVDLMALVTSESNPIILFASSSYARILGYHTNQQIIPGKSSFLEHVHPDQIQEIKSIFARFTTAGETRRFQFKIRSANGDFFIAETFARMTEKGVVCSTRVEQRDL